MTTTRSQAALTKLITEKDFMAQVVALAQTLGWRVWHCHDSRRSAAGFPDLVMIRDRRILFCELKSERGRVREEQQDWLQALNRAGAEWYVWRPRNWDEVAQILSA